MKLSIYVIVDERADRPYVSTTPPSNERAAGLKQAEAEIFRVDVELPSRYTFTKVVEAKAEPV